LIYFFPEWINEQMLHVCFVPCCILDRYFQLQVMSVLVNSILILLFLDCSRQIIHVVLLVQGRICALPACLESRVEITEYHMVHSSVCTYGSALSIFPMLRSFSVSDVTWSVNWGMACPPILRYVNFSFVSLQRLRPSVWVL
jgi:hypothetical protein